MDASQGSVLSFLFFLIQINDLQNCMRSISRLFADDTAVLFGAKSLKQPETHLNFEMA